jgi:5'-nucleotidase
MALGYDGYEPMKAGKMLIDDESGLIMSTIIRQFLLGATFITRKKRLMERRQQLEQEQKQKEQGHTPSNFLSPKTEGALNWQEPGSKAHPTDGGQVVNQGWRSVRNAIRVARREHMSEVRPPIGRLSFNDPLADSPHPSSGRRMRASVLWLRCAQCGPAN